METTLSDIAAELATIRDLLGEMRDHNLAIIKARNEETTANILIREAKHEILTRKKESFEVKV